MVTRRAPLSGVPDYRHTRAVAACARALGDVADADALLAQSSAATHSGLRAFADRVVLQRRFHDAAVHHRYRPDETDAADLFDAVEQARLDALGAGWLPGIARNLLAHPGADDDGVRWLVFETVSGQAAPKSKAALTARVKSELPPVLLDRLGALRDAAPDQSAFAAAAAEWVRAVRTYVRREQSAPGTIKTFTLPLRYIDKYQRRGRYESPVGAAARSTKKDGTRHAGSDDGASPAGAVVEPTGQEVGYRVFTTTHDRVVNAATVDRKSVV